MRTYGFRIAIFNFFLAACIGLLLRYAFVEEVSWFRYRYLMHAHAHLAMMGWGYLGIYVLFIREFLHEKANKKPVYSSLFWLTQVAVIGMVISLIMEGYGWMFVVCGLLYVLLSYGFVYHFFRDLTQSGEKNRYSRLFAKTSLTFLVLSSLSVWATGIILVGGWQGSLMYYLNLQFFLHFQFNGFFLFAILALFFLWIENRKLEMPPPIVKRFHHLLVAATLLTYALAVAWSNPLEVIFWINSLGVLVQLAALVLFLLLLGKIHARIAEGMQAWNLILWKLALFSFILKILVQSAVVIPYIATIAYTIRNYVIGFIHLLLLGVVSSFLIAYSSQTGLAPLTTRLSKTGIILFAIGLIVTEVILILQGTMFWNAMGFLPWYYEILFGTSILLPLGLGLYLLGMIGNPQDSLR